MKGKERSNLKSGAEKIQIAASTLSAYFSRLGEQVEEALEEGVEWIHQELRAAIAP